MINLPVVGWLVQPPDGRKEEGRAGRPVPGFAVRDQHAVSGQGSKLPAAVRATGTSLEASLARTGLPALLILAQSRTLLSRVMTVGWINPDGFQAS
jgi:hypothetical protein